MDDWGWLEAGNVGVSLFDLKEWVNWTSVAEGGRKSNYATPKLWSYTHFISLSLSRVHWTVCVSPVHFPALSLCPCSVPVALKDEPTRVVSILNTRLSFWWGFHSGTDTSGSTMCVSSGHPVAERYGPLLIWFESHKFIAHMLRVMDHVQFTFSQPRWY